MKPVVLVKDLKECSACGACFVVCPKQAISMTENADGCKYPEIDDEKCIRCGKCLKVCSYHNSIQTEMPKAAYAAVGQVDSLVENSASGGIFASLAKSHIDKGSLVAGVVMDCSANELQVYHVLSDKIEDIYRMQGSKYVQSDAWKCYKDVERAICKGKKVLFSGTPCQVSAIKQLTGDPEELVTIDLVCHGIPPVKMLKEYLDILSKRFRGVICNFSFRDKACDREYCARIDTERHGKKRSRYLSSSCLSFYKYFLSGTIIRENCYSCPYAGLKRVADITIGDYWGIEKFHGEDIATGGMPRRNDWSCVLVNTKKGEYFLEENKTSLTLFPSKMEWIAENNQQLKRPSKKASNREQVMAVYRGEGYTAVEKMFIKDSGGKLRFYWRLFKNLYRNQKSVMSKREDS